MKKSTRFIVCILILFSVLAVFVSCQSEPASTQDTDDGTESLISELMDAIISDGVANYTLVYPDNPSKPVKETVNRFLMVIKDATGVTLESKSDYIKRGALYNSNTQEILFGRTDITKRYETVVENRVHWLSDHSPHFADVSFS